MVLRFLALLILPSTIFANVFSISAINRDAENSTPMQFEGETLYIDNTPIITKKDVVKVFVMKNEYGLGYVLNFEISTEAQNKLKKYTSENLGEKMAFIIDNRLISAPIIREPLGQYFQVVLGEFSNDMMKILRIKNQILFK